MKRSMVLLVLFVIGIGFVSAHTLTIRVENADVGKGLLRIGLDNNEESFSSEIPFRGEKVTVTDKVTIVTFDDLPAGKYAVSIYQDRNGNEKIDTTIFGIPTEKYGFSNGIRLPSFKRSSIDLDGDMTITIRIR
jgi:uncharacterized protein (DUF2141 family)